MKLPKAISPQIIVQFEKATGLTFVSEDVAESNVCFANNPELRSEFKSTFRKIDIEYYLLGLLQLQNIRDLTLPKDDHTFWKLVKLGK